MPLACRHSSLCFNGNGKDTDNSAWGIKKSRMINSSSYPGFSNLPLYSQWTHSRTTLIQGKLVYTFSHSRITRYDIFFPFASNRRISKWSVKKIVVRQISLISHFSITVTNVKTKTTTTTAKMTFFLSCSAGTWNSELGKSLSPSAHSLPALANKFDSYS